MSKKHKLSVKISALHPEQDWGIGVISLPMPADEDFTPEIPGCQVQAVPVAWWPRTEKTPGGPKRPRRMLTFFTPKEKADHYEVSFAPPKPAAPPSESFPWTLRFLKANAQEIRSNKTHWYYLREDGELLLQYKGSGACLRLGVENEHGLHWWQYLNLSPLWSGPLCCAWRIGGHIFTGPDHPYTHEETKAFDDLHQEQMMSASIFLILFADGTMQTTAHWINGRIYGHNGFCPGRPVAGFNGVKLNLPEGGMELTGAEMVFPAENNVTLDLSPSRDLVSPHRPGQLRYLEDGLLLWAPLQSTAVQHRIEPARRYDSDIGRPFPKARAHLSPFPGEETCEAFETAVLRSWEGFLEGVSASAPFGWRIGPGPTQIQRFLAEPQWYADQLELGPVPFKITTGVYSALAEEAGEHTLNNAFTGSLTRGGIPRYFYTWGIGALELDFDGNQGRSMMRLAYWKTDPRLYACALNNGYCMADAGLDHSRDIIHYHGDTDRWRTFSMIYQRFTSLVTSYIETGDYYLLEAAHAVAQNYISLHLMNWPRRGMGRDAEPLSGIMALYDYTGDEHYLAFARTFAEHMMSTLSDDGNWISGAGVGPVMGCNALEGSPWNGAHLSTGFTQYAMRMSHDLPAGWKETMRKFLKVLYDRLEVEHHGFHPASSGFLGMQHWFLACLLEDETLIQRTKYYMDKVLEYRRAPWEANDIFHGGKAHHQYNYMDNPLFFEATKDTLPQQIKALLKPL